MARIRALTLDAAGTLIRVRHPVGETYAGVARTFDIALSPEQIDRQFRTLFPRMTPLAFGHCSLAELHRQERNWWQTLVRNCLGVHARHANFKPFFNRVYDYYASPEAWSLYPEIVEVLEQLREQSLPFSVVSNFDSRLPGLLEALGISHFFRHIHYSSRAGSAKPQAGIFELACGHLGSEPGATLHIGDHYTADFMGAERAGLQALLLRRNVSCDEPHQIPSLRGLPERLPSGMTTSAEQDN